MGVYARMGFDTKILPALGHIPGCFHQINLLSIFCSTVEKVGVGGVPPLSYFPFEENKIVSIFFCKLFFLRKS